MPGRRLPGWGRPALRIGLGLLVLALLAGLLVASGLYNVAARTGHWEITRVFLEFALRRSVATHSLGTEVPPLEDRDLVALGAGHFANGCAPCHGSPGRPANPVVRQMLPQPPDLSHAAQTWRDRELFWILRNGLKYTGMPAWPAPQRVDEVWAVVAFLRQLPAMTPGRYAEMTRGDPPGGVTDIDRLAEAPGPAACAACHGDERSRPSSALVPELAMLPAPYMEAALVHYARGLRQSGIMQPIAAALDPRDIERLAAYYAGVDREGSDPQTPGDPESIERGRRIATAGVPERGIPPCLVCHGAGAAAIFPRLAGQHAPYLAGQLRLWQRGLRAGSVTGAIMAPVAKRLEAAQIEDVAAYFASLPDNAHDPNPQGLAGTPDEGRSP